MAAEPSSTTRVYTQSVPGRLEQGEILSDIRLVRADPASLGGEIQLIEVEYAYAVILSQACDLDRDWEYRAAIAAGVSDSKEAEQLKNSKELGNVLLCPARPAAEVKPTVGGSDIWKRVKNNKDERYQVIEAVPQEHDAANRGIEPLCFDFRQYVTVPTEELYERLNHGAQRRSRLMTPYSEHLSYRFGHYLARIGLPRDHDLVLPALPAPAARTK